MTPSRYFITRLAQGFGYLQRNQRMAEAASEMHLLREAEMQLGFLVWENVSDIDQLSIEYWNLRRLLREKEALILRAEESNAQLENAQAIRIAILNSTPESQQELLDERVQLLIDLENLGKQRDEIIAEAREIRRFFDGMKMKIEVLKNESADEAGNQESLDKAEESLANSKIRFAELKQNRLEIGVLIEAGDAKIDAVDQQLDALKKDRRTHASQSFQAISDGNREVSTLRAELSMLDIQARQLYSEIGRYVSRNSNHLAACAHVAAPHQSMVDVMRALRRSIALNHRLANNS